MKRSFYHISAMIATSLLLSISSSYAFNWCKAPLACLPDRAVKWKTNTNPEPCHCPPQSYCVALNLEPADVLFISQIVQWPDISADRKRDYQPIYIKGNQIPELVSKEVSISDVLKMPNMTHTSKDGDPLQHLLAPTILKLTGIDTLHQGDIRNVTTTIQLNNPSKISDWIEKQKMPLSLASRCCDSVCPEGFTPELGKTQVNKVKEHITFTQKEIIDVKKVFVEIVDIIYSQIPKAPCPTPCSKNNENEEESGNPDNSGNENSGDSGNNGNNQNLPPILLSETYDTNQAFYNALKAALEQLTPALDAFAANPNNTQAVLTVNAAIKQFMTVYETSITDIKAMTKVQYTVAMEFYTKTKTEETVITKPHETVTVDTLQCKVSKTFYREGCILKGTPITLADGTVKPIEELNIGDEVLGNQGKAKIKAKSRFSQEVDYMYSINGEKAFFTVEHPILTPKGWKSIDPNITSTKKGNTVIIGPLQVGDTLLLKDGKTVEVKSIEKVEVKGNPDAYNLSIEGDGSFIANGYIMKGFKQMQMHY